MHGGSSWADPPVPDFSDNSNPLGPPRELIRLVKEAVERMAYLKFPANLVEEALSEYEGVEVTAFNGATEALTVLLASLRPRRVLIEWPNYTDYGRIAELIGAEYVYVDNFNSAGPGDVAIISNPNNPTGRLRKREEVLDLAGQLERRGAVLVVDESFIDFTSEPSAAPDVLVVKSYGKFLAAPGLRLGGILGRVRGALKAPWRVNSIADYAVFHLGASAMRRHREATVKYVAEESPRVQRELGKCASVVPSPVHFFIVKGPMPQGVKVRPLTTHGIEGAYRVSIKTRELNDVLIKAMCREVS